MNSGHFNHGKMVICPFDMVILGNEHHFLARVPTATNFWRFDSFFGSTCELSHCYWMTWTLPPGYLEHAGCSWLQSFQTRLKDLKKKTSAHFTRAVNEMHFINSCLNTVSLHLLHPKKKSKHVSSNSFCPPPTWQIAKGQKVTHQLI